MDGDKLKVLLVEDNPEIRRLYAIGLNQRGYEVKLAANGAEAVDRMIAERPSLVLLDWMMPLMDGQAVVDRLEAWGDDDSGIEIIVISGHPPPPTIPSRVRTWLIKPVTIEELVREIERPGPHVRELRDLR